MKKDNNTTLIQCSTSYVISLGIGYITEPAAFAYVINTLFAKIKINQGQKYINFD